jgi:hypothetical protein
VTELVACDLDRTLIYSAAALDLPADGSLDERAPRLLCVEVYQRRPLSFLTERAAGLYELLSAAATVVPTTTRTRAQYGRIRLPGPPAGYAVCANGGHLLVDGVADPDWHASVTGRLAAASAPLAEVVAHLAATADPAWTVNRRVAEDLFCYLVVDREALPAAYVDDLTGWCAERGWAVSLQLRKLYCVPAGLTKSAAVAEVASRAGTGWTLAAGDSVLDAELLDAADAGARPAHGELHDAGWTRPHVQVTARGGVLGGEELLGLLLAECGHAVARPRKLPNRGPDNPGHSSVHYG